MALMGPQDRSPGPSTVPRKAGGSVQSLTVNIPVQLRTEALMVKTPDPPSDKGRPTPPLK